MRVSYLLLLFYCASKKVHCRLILQISGDSKKEEKKKFRFNFELQIKCDIIPPLPSRSRRKLALDPFAIFLPLFVLLTSIMHILAVSLPRKNEHFCIYNGPWHFSPCKEQMKKKPIQYFRKLPWFFYAISRYFA